jgi:hypothetical protein
MEWINVFDALPKIHEVVWIYWRDREVLLGCRINDDSEPHENWYSFDDDKCRWTYWWQKVSSENLDKPFPPLGNTSSQPERLNPETPKGDAIV